jgi:hypothetical protein
MGCFTIIITIFCAAGFAGNTPTEDKVTFHFNPPDGTSFVETVRHTKSTVAKELTEPIAQIKESKVKYVIRKTDFGYSVVMKPLQPRIKASEDVSGMLTDVLSNVVLTHDLDTQGKLLRVGGIKVALEELKRTMPAGEELTDLVLSFLGKTMEQLAEDTWNNRGMGMLGNLVGKTYPLNKVSPSVPARLPLPLGGTMAASMRLKISGPTARNGRECVKIEYSYESTDPNVGEKLGEAMRYLIVGLLKKTGSPEADKAIERIPHFQISDSRSMYTLEQLADPATGLIYSEVETKTMEALFGLEGMEKSMFTIKETKEYFYAYKNN